ncbi:hypothetical protein Micbo1qcDRAFT_154093 [Microdochium bolleyi]|uniref:Zn(2)-C6 fungal-type domain-containing protein n=1 Tax=Microdochium bolleyi TaxID=196109 RepID=A0A136IKT7_9PEZI|nr:hypothetical protein Micbo1qcDRAFT_154093 [Microdochium bolleyi]
MLPIRQSPAAAVSEPSTTLPSTSKSPPSDSATASADSKPSSAEPPAAPKKQCWECQRRRIVCDSASPVCRKCETAGVVCPGFDDKKPLTWLAPGKVTARPRKKKRAPNGSRAFVAAAKRGLQIAEKLTGEKPTPVDFESLLWRKIPPSGVHGLRKATDIEQVFQAARYYDLQIYPEYSPILDMIPQAFVRKFDLPTIPYFPLSIRHSLICLTLGHRINQLPASADPAFVATSWSVFYSHRGKAIAGLTEDMGSLDPVKRFIALISTAMFLMVDIQQCYPDWRIHYVGLRHLLDLCGGFDFVIGLGMETNAVMHIYILCGIMANTITHREQQITCVTLSEQRKFVRNTYDEKVMPYFMCPRPILETIITINELRAESGGATFHYLLPEGVAPALATPDELMAEIEAFDTVAWADGVTRGHQPQVVVLGELWKSTALLYCIISLQATGLVPRSSFELEVTKALHGDKLFGLLRAHVRSNILLQKSCLFSVAVAGFMAAERGEEDRRFVRDQCEFLCKASGQATALMLLVALQAFWDSGKTEWDECFEKGYALSVA